MRRPGPRRRGSDKRVLLLMLPLALVVLISGRMYMTSTPAPVPGTHTIGAQAVVTETEKATWTFETTFAPSSDPTPEPTVTKQTITLNNGLEMPLLGLGTAALGGSDVGEASPARKSIRWALQAGYLLIDSASQDAPWYKTEDLIPELLTELKIPREKVWIETKLHPKDLGFKSTLRAFEQSLRLTGGSYVDLFLIHYPECFRGVPGCENKVEGTYLDSWRAMEQLVKEKKVRGIGLSNVGPWHLDEIYNKVKSGEFSVLPTVVQNFFDPFHQERSLHAKCKEKGVVLQAYSSLGGQYFSRKDNRPALSHPLIKKIAARYRKSPAQVVIKWGIQNGVPMIPRSRSQNRIVENAQIWDFEISDEEMREIDALEGKLPPDHEPQA